MRTLLWQFRKQLMFNQQIYAWCPLALVVSAVQKNGQDKFHGLQELIKVSGFHSFLMRHYQWVCSLSRMTIKSQRMETVEWGNLGWQIEKMETNLENQNLSVFTFSLLRRFILEHQSPAKNASVSDNKADQNLTQVVLTPSGKGDTLYFELHESSLLYYSEVEEVPDDEYD